MGLRDEPSRPNATQELDAGDILEVEDVAAAIERAERLVRSGRNADTLDVFDALVARRTDDASGPALHAAVRPTPVPPARSTPIPPPPTPPRAPLLLVPEDDAFYHPMGRMRSLADGTLETQRAEPTMLVRIRKRRGKLSWLVAGLLLPFAALAVLGAVGASEPTPSVAIRHRHIVFAKVQPVQPVPAAAPMSGPPTVDVNSLPSAARR